MNKELHDALEYLEHERGIDRETLLALMEESLRSALNKVTPLKRGLSAVIDRKTLEYICTARPIVVEEVEEPAEEISLAEAKKRFPEAKVGDELEWQFDSAVFGRIAAQNARQVIMQGVHQAQRRNQCGHYAEQMMQLISGEVKRIDREGIVIAFAEAEGILPKDERIPGENFEIGDIVTVLLTDVNPDKSGPALTLSRRHPDFVRRLFEREVTEISTGLVTIKGIARDAGFRSKIAVQSNEPRIDAMGACVGMRGSRVRSIVRELGGEKVDIIEYSDDLRVYIANALKPARLNSIAVNEEKKTVIVHAELDQFSLALGKKGQNVRLASRLTGWHIDLVKDEVQEAPADDYDSQLKRAIDAVSALDGITAEEAETLVKNGFVNVEGILAAEEYIDDIANLPGFNQERAIAVIEAARVALGK